MTLNDDRLYDERRSPSEPFEPFGRKTTDEKHKPLETLVKANLRAYRLFSFNIVCSNMINHNTSINIRFIHLDAL